MAASTGTTASESSMKSPRWESSSSPIGVSSDTGSCETFMDLAHLLGADAHDLADLVRRGLAAQVLEQLALDAHELVDRLDHVHGDADGARLVGDGARDGLADPPRGVRRELVALRVVELLHRADQAEVALLDQVQEQHPAAHVALGDATPPAGGSPRSACSWRAGRRARRGGSKSIHLLVGLRAGSTWRSSRGRCLRPCRTPVELVLADLHDRLDDSFGTAFGSTFAGRRRSRRQLGGELAAPRSAAPGRPPAPR